MILQSKNSIPLLSELETYLKQRKEFVFYYFPLVRIQLGYHLHLIRDNKIQLDKLDHTISFDVKKITLRDLYLLIRLWIMVFTLKIRNRNLLKNKVLLFGIAEHYYKYNNDEKYNLYNSPLKQELAKQGLPFEELLISYTRNNIEATKITAFYSVLNQYYNLLFLLKAQLFNVQNRYIQNTKAVETFFQSKSITQTGYFFNLFYRIQIAQSVNYKAFKTLLKTTKPKLIWDYCYYDNNVMALNRAANSLKIKNIEYQHSQQSDEHFAYAKWNNMDLYKDFFPNTFWVWKQNDADRIKRNFTDKEHTPHVLVGGNLAVIKQKERYNYKTDDYKNGILISLQGMWVPDFLEKFIEEDTKYKWYFRLHPRYPEDKEKLITFVAKYSNKVETEQANKLSLYELFTKVNIHITHFSGTALEAEDFGLTNIIVGEKGKNIFKKEIENKIFLFAQNLSEFKKQLEMVNIAGKEKIVTKSIDFEHLFQSVFFS